MLSGVLQHIASAPGVSCTKIVIITQTIMVDAVE